MSVKKGRFVVYFKVSRDGRLRKCPLSTLQYDHVRTCYEPYSDPLNLHAQGFIIIKRTLVVLIDGCYPWL
jgi:hypothetical protein